MHPTKTQPYMGIDPQSIGWMLSTLVLSQAPPGPKERGQRDRDLYRERQRKYWEEEAQKDRQAETERGKDRDKRDEPIKKQLSLFIQRERNTDRLI